MVSSLFLPSGVSSPEHAIVDEEVGQGTAVPSAQKCWHMQSCHKNGPYSTTMSGKTIMTISQPRLIQSLASKGSRSLISWLRKPNEFDCREKTVQNRKDSAACCPAHTIQITHASERSCVATAPGPLARHRNTPHRHLKRLRLETSSKSAPALQT